MTYYDSNKYDSATTELAHAFANDFMLDDEFGDSSTDTWNGLVTISEDGARKAGVPESLIHEAIQETPEISYGDWTIWIQEDSDGFVTKLTAGDFSVLGQSFEAAADEFYENEFRDGDDYDSDWGYETEDDME